MTSELKGKYDHEPSKVLLNSKVGVKGKFRRLSNELINVLPSGNFCPLQGRGITKIELKIIDILWVEKGIPMWIHFPL